MAADSAGPSECAKKQSISNDTNASRPLEAFSHRATQYAVRGLGRYAIPRRGNGESRPSPGVQGRVPRGSGCRYVLWTLVREVFSPSWLISETRIRAYIRLVWTSDSDLLRPKSPTFNTVQGLDP